MTRGTTPTHIFTLPIFAANISKLRITYTQGQTVVLEKTEKDVERSGKTLRYTLTQEETLRFNAKSGVNVQIRVVTIDDMALASPIKKLAVSDVLNEEVL